MRIKRCSLRAPLLAFPAWTLWSCSHFQQSIEEAWAAKAHGHAVSYFQIISNISAPRMLILTPQDTEIYEAFRKDFPALDVKSLDMPKLKSKAAKEVKTRMEACVLWNFW